MVESAAIYPAVVDRLLALATTLSESQQAAIPMPTPDWTVVDTYRHLAGATADFLDGRLDGAGTPDWTAAHVSARAGRSLSEVCEEWADRAPELTARMTADPTLFPRLAVGFWIHEQDIRVAVGIGPLRDDRHVAAMAHAMLDSRAQPYEDSGAPTLRVLAPDQSVDVVVGKGEPALTVRTDAFELLRMVTSRRSLTQWLGADWTGGDLAARRWAVAALAAFPLPVTDIID